MKKKYLPTNKICLILSAIAVMLFAVQAIAQDDKSNNDADNPAAVFNLDEIVITGTKTPHALKDVPVQTIVITHGDIEETSAQTVSDVLRTIPGMFVIAENIPGITAWRTKLRGLDLNSGYGLILVNGQRVKGGGMGEYGYGVNQIPLSTIEQIEVIKGPGSVLYGSDAMGGVINIITKAAPQTPIMGMDVAVGSNGTRVGSVYGGTSMDKLGLFFNASTEQSKVGAFGYNSTRNEVYDAKRIDSRLTYEFSDKIKTSLILAVEDQERTRQYKTKDVLRHNWEKKYRIAPSANIDIDKVSSAVISGYYYNWNMNSMESGSDSSGFTPTVGDMFYHNIEGKYTRTIWDGYQLTMGGELLEEKLEYNMANENIGTMSGYAQLEADLTDTFTVVVGTRYDDHEKYGEYISPKLSFMYHPLEDTTIRGSVGKGFKSPTIRQLYYTELYQHSTYWYQSNPDLDAEESVGYSLSVEQGIGDRFLCEVTLFRNDIKNKVLNIDTGTFQDGLPITTFKNISKAHTQGLEFGLKVILSKGLSGHISYAYTDTEDEDTGKELTYVPTNNITGGLTYDYASWGLTLSANVQYASEVFKDTDNINKTDDYTLVDLKIAKTLGQVFTLSLEGSNIFDSDYGQPERDWLGATYLVRLSMEL